MLRAKVLATKTTAFIIAVALACATAVFAVTPAYASDVPWNSNVTVTANAYNPTYAEDQQYINVTMEFASTLADITASDMETYLEANTYIASRTIAADSDSYTRDVTNVVINGDTVTFTICPNSEGSTANYNGELLIEANSDDSLYIAAAMGNADVETLINNGITISKVSGSYDFSVFKVATRAQARGMNHILVTDVINGKETAIFDSSSGSFEYGGITVHSHSFTELTVADYASTLVSTANNTATIEGTSYTFTYTEGGQFTVTNNDGSSANIQVYVYNGDYLNANQLSVGSIYEAEWSVDD